MRFSTESAEQPRIVTFDDPAIAFDHQIGGYRPVNLDTYYLGSAVESQLTGLGAVQGLCPPCAFFEQDGCHWCPDESAAEFPSDRPECAGCKGRQPMKQAWYEREDVMIPLLTSVIVSTAAAVFSTMILKRTGYAG